MEIFSSLQGVFAIYPIFWRGTKIQLTKSWCGKSVAPSGSDTEVTDFANWESWQSSYSHGGKGPRRSQQKTNRVDGVDML